jgi:hypothetical protein
LVPVQLILQTGFPTVSLDVQRAGFKVFDKIHTQKAVALCAGLFNLLSRKRVVLDRNRSGFGTGQCAVDGEVEVLWLKLEEWFCERVSGQ